LRSLEQQIAQSTDQYSKLKESYEVLKEHELSIVKLNTQKSKETKKALNTKIEQMQEQLSDKNREIQEMTFAVRKLEDTVRQLQYECQRSNDQLSSLQNEKLKLEQNISMRL
jgi:chromosome segregation ATPase